MSWTNAMASNLLEEGAKHEVEVNDTELVVIRFQSNVYAIAARCPHMGGHLEDGTLTPQGTIICPRHHSEFDLRTGEVKAWAPYPAIASPVLGVLSQKKNLRVYEAREEGGQVMVNLPD